MWTRKQVKEQGKTSFKRNYWKSVLVALILAVITGTGGFIGSNLGNHAGSEKNYEAEASSMEETIINSMDPAGNIISGDDIAVIAAVLIGVFLVFLIVLVIAFALDALLINPVELGCDRFFLKNLDNEAQVSEVTFGFDHSYRNIAKTLFFRELYTFLWSLLFIIPGIVKSYEYRMMPYILAENPDLSKEEVFARSKAMMNGQKWNAFVLDLSFIGWYLLSILTAGLLAVFYVNPYRSATNAALYATLKNSEVGNV